jgi:hypothetical protein
MYLSDLHAPGISRRVEVPIYFLSIIRTCICALPAETSSISSGQLKNLPFCHSATSLIETQEAGRSPQRKLGFTLTEHGHLHSSSLENMLAI